jgi:glycosyltransferase involved in cell wall biosynthesis
LPSYRSLEFLFDKVWPNLPPEVSNRISLNVVGTVDPGNERTKRIMDLARPYSNVVFKGFVKDVRAEYRESDVQVVASTDATGLRTRIIESFAYGLPVLSTSTAAQGIRGLKPGETLLVADDAAQFVNVLSELCGSEKLLTKLSSSGRDFYEQNNSRAAVAASLGESLRRHLGVEV